MPNAIPSLERITVRRYREEDSIAEITVLLHAAYAPLAAMGLRYTATHQDDEVTLLRLQRGWAWVAELDGKIIGTVTLYSDPKDSSGCDWYRTPGVFYFGQFAVHPDLQGGGLGTRLIALMEQETTKKGGKELALDTAEGATQLIHWYEKLGFRLIERVFWGTTNYRSVVMSKKLGLGDGH